MGNAILELARALTTHCRRITVRNGNTLDIKSLKKWGDDKILGFLVENFKQDKDAFVYVNYDFIKQEWSSPMKLHEMNLENFTRDFVYDYAQMAIYALEKELLLW